MEYIQHQHQYLIYDYKNGDIVDPTTGEVVGKIYDYQIYSYSYDEDRLTMVTTPVYLSSPIHPLYLNSSSKYECLISILHYFDDLKQLEHLPVSRHDVEVTLRYLLKKLKKHRHTKIFKLSLLYIALELNRVHIDIYRLADIFNVPVQLLKSTIFSLKQELNIKTSMTEKMIYFVQYYSKQLGIPSEIVKSATNVISSKPYPCRFTPKSIALAVLYVQVYNSKSIPRSTIRKLSKFIKSKYNFKRVVEFVRQYYYGEQT